MISLVIVLLNRGKLSSVSKVVSDGRRSGAILSRTHPFLSSPTLHSARSYSVLCSPSNVEQRVLQHENFLSIGVCVCGASL